MMWKIIKYTLLGLLLLATVWLVNAIWFKPLNIDHFYNRIFTEFALNSPELLSKIRILEQFGITAHQDDWDDESQAHKDEQFQKLKANLVTLQSYDREALSYQQNLSFDILEWFLKRQIDQEKWQFHNYPVNQLFGLQNNVPTFMESTHQVNSIDDAQDYVTRLSKIDRKFAQVMDGLKHRELLGIIPPRFVIEKVLTEMQNFVDTPAEKNILYVSLQEKLGKLHDLPASERNSLLTDASKQINEAVYPAYRSYIEYFSELKHKATDDAGVWKLPDGDKYYAFALAGHTTTDMTPDEVHALGVSEVARIQQEMRSILTAQGYDAEKSVGELVRNLSHEARFTYPDSEEGRAQILVDYQKIIDEISAGLDGQFAVKPKAGVKVERIPQFKEKTSPGAYYNAPAMDGSRPGIFYANLYDINATPKYDMRTLAYHEAVPGHHFQIAIAQELQGLPIFRRMLPFTVYAEGWALYAERVAWEAGFQKDPFDDLGRLQAELFRAVRLVVDTGIHAKRWTREEAIAYMQSNTGMAESDVVAEIERYIVMPGQACAYKIGMIKILALREQAKTALGDRFDIRAFHDVVLKNGSMPLAVLDRVVQDWIAAQK